MEQVELHQAYVWDCETCGTENFCRCITADLNDDDREAAYRHFVGLEDYQSLPEGWRNFTLTTCPDQVTCSTCGGLFKTIDQRGEGPELC